VTYLISHLVCSTSSTAHETRWKQVRQSIETSGHYQLTETELIYGAKLAWRNSSRCIGRIQWSKLQVGNNKIELCGKYICQKIIGFKI